MMPDCCSILDVDPFAVFEPSEGKGPAVSDDALVQFPVGGGGGGVGTGDGDDPDPLPPHDARSVLPVNPKITVRLSSMA